MKELVAILVPIACGCVLPIMVVWLDIRKKMNETNQRTQIVLAAIEKNCWRNCCGAVSLLSLVLP